jgi:hypothetical protein
MNKSANTTAAQFMSPRDFYGKLMYNHRSSKASDLEVID